MLTFVVFEELVELSLVSEESVVREHNNDFGWPAFEELLESSQARTPILYDWAAITADMIESNPNLLARCKSQRLLQLICQGIIRDGGANVDRSYLILLRRLETYRVSGVYFCHAVFDICVAIVVGVRAHDYVPRKSCLNFHTNQV